jgi:selenide,water dikinase
MLRRGPRRLQSAAKEVVLVGAGHAHLEALRRLSARRQSGEHLTLLTRSDHTTYSGMLPGVIAGLYRPEEARIDAARVAAAAGARLVIDEATGIDTQARLVHRRQGEPLRYDVLSINIGATANVRGVPGAAEHAIAVKPIEGLIANVEAMGRRIREAGGRARIGVVGGGAGGVELILALERRLRRDVAAAGLAAEGLSFMLITAAEVLPTFSRRLRQRITAILSERGIGVVAGARVVAVERGAVSVAGRGRVDLDEVLWVTEAAPAPWLKETALALDAEGFIEVEATLQSVSHADVLAAGDSASVRGHPRPKAGVHAVRAGALIAANVGRLAAGRRPIARMPQRRALALISTGERYALGARNGLTFEGAWVWRLKDAIDRRFVARFARLTP